VQDVDLAALVREVLETHRLRVEAAGLRIAAGLPEQELTVPTDRDAIEQALVNLIDNAVKYAARGGELVVELRPGSRHVEVRVLDRGRGIPEAHRERIFDKFHRVDDSLRTPQPGSGLGLSIARCLVRDLGGDLQYAPRDGGGSCFSLRLPL
jgi:signal transduction histidine kinase